MSIEEKPKKVTKSKVKDTAKAEKTENKVTETATEKANVAVASTEQKPIKAKKISVFKRLKKEDVYSNFGRIFTAKTAFNGKPFKVQIIAKDVVRYNAKFISEKLRIANTKHCSAVKKLVDSCMANARFFGVDDSKLCIRSIQVGSGQRPRRVEFKGRGRTGLQRPPRAKVEVKLQEVNFG